MKFHISALALIFSLFGYSQKPDFAPVEFPNYYSSRIDEIYTIKDQWEGRIDIYYNPQSLKPTPLVINIHGGGWNHGQKESQRGFGSFFHHGFAVANVEYRLSGVAAAPAAIEDVRCALIYLLNNSKELNFDPKKVVIMGSSAGSHLGLLAGLLGDDSSFDSDCNCKLPIKIAAIIDKYGPVDLTGAAGSSSFKKWVQHNIDNQQFIESISPIFYVEKNSPPVFIIHGTKDSIVPYDQSVKLYNKLLAFGVKAELFTVEGGGHGKFNPDEKIRISEKMWSFLADLGLME